MNRYQTRKKIECRRDGKLVCYLIPFNDNNSNADTNSTTKATTTTITIIIIHLIILSSNSKATKASYRVNTIKYIKIEGKNTEI
jgi:hypothetical protein